MKKLLFVLLIVLPLTSFAQRFSGGVVLGFNASQIDGDTWGGYYKAGIVGGAFVFTELQNNWGAQLEIRYAAKGSSPSPKYQITRKIRLQYIEMPVLATYQINNNFQAQGGISIGYLYSAAQNDGNGYEEFDQFDSIEPAICAGVKYSGFDKLSLNIRLSYSILPIYAEYSGASIPYGMYNNVITFACYYQIGG